MENKKYIYTYNKKCEVCKKEFQTQGYSVKICSSECVKLKLSQKRKYTEKQISLAISLRMTGMILSEITKQTGIKKPSLQKIFQENNVRLSEENKKSALSRRWIDHEPVVDNRKLCSKCKAYKTLEEFHKNNNRYTGRVSCCKNCYKQFYEENNEEIIKRNKFYRKNNPERSDATYQKLYENNQTNYIEKAVKWSRDNPEKRKLIEKRYNKKNQKQKNARTANYRAKKKQRTPTWITEDQIKQINKFYTNCPKGYHVDHIIPLLGDNVSGLHVPWNLQYLSEYQNESKSNCFDGLKLQVGTCHQYKRKQETASEDVLKGMPFSNTIQGFNFGIEEFSNEHDEFIKRYEWLGNKGYTVKWTFTARFEGKLGGIVLISEPYGYTDLQNGKKLEALIARGATASWTPKNLGSKLVMFACRWMVKNTTKRVFFGYSDHSAGEIGTIYQACNFNYLGAYFGSRVYYKLENGKKVNSRFFRKTSTFRAYAKELGIEWKKEWTKANKYMDRNSIPRDILDLLSKKSKLHQELCEQIVGSPKGKYVLMLGVNKRETKTVYLKYSNIFGKFEPYPKRK